MRRFFAALAVLLFLAGCSLPANPKTRIQANAWGWTFENSKDVEILLKNAKADVDTGNIEIEELQIRDNASEVRRANVEQIQAYTEQVRAVTLMFEQMTRAIAAIIPQTVARPSEGAMPPEWQPIYPMEPPDPNTAAQPIEDSDDAG